MISYGPRRAPGARVEAKQFYATPNRRTATREPRESMKRPPPIDHEHVADDHVREMAGQEQHRTDEILRLVPSARRQHLCRRPLLVAGALEDDFSRLRFGDARRDDVDRHAVLRPFERQRT